MSIQAITKAMAIRGVSSSEKLLLIALANYADEDGRCYPSQRRLSEDTCLSDRTVRSLLVGLVERGMIRRKERVRPDGSRGSDIITLLFCAEISGGAEMVSGGVRKSLPGGAEMVSGLTTFEPSLEPSEEPDDVERADVDWSKRVDEAQSVASGALDMTSPGVHHAADLRALCETSSGVPCEWADVLDAIRAAAARAKTRGKPIRSWSWVREDAIRIRDARLLGLPDAEKPQDRPRTLSYAEQASASWAEAKRRLLEADQ